MYIERVGTAFERASERTKWVGDGIFCLYIRYPIIN